MDKDDRDLLITVNAKVSNLCRSVDELKDRLESNYATKDWTDARLGSINREVKNNALINFLNSKGGIALVIIVGLVLFAGMQSLFGTDGMTDAEIKQLIAEQLKGL